MLKLGTSDISNLKLGSSQILSLYSGTSLLWTNAPATDPDADAFIAAASITDPTQQSAINELVVELKALGLWSKMYAIYPFVGGSAGTHKWNLKDPRDLDAAYRLSFFGGWTHNANGITGNGSNTYANTHINPWSIDANRLFFQQVYLRTTAHQCVMGCMNLAGTAYTYYYATGSNDFRAGVNTNTITRKVPSTTPTTGNYTALRQASATHFYRNDVLEATASGSGADCGLLFIGCLRRDDFSPGALYSNSNMSMVMYGNSVTTSELADLDDVIQTFQTTLGRNV